MHFAHIGQDQLVDDVTEFEKRTLFPSMCYKVNVRLGVTKKVTRLKTAIFDTRAGPNLIRKGVLPPDNQTHVMRFKM